MSSLFAQLSAANKAPPPPPPKVRRSGVAAAKVTRKANLYARWEETFRELKSEAPTGVIAAHLGRSHMGVYSSLSSLEGYGWVVRSGSLPHPKNGRDQIIWKWVGHAQ